MSEPKREIRITRYKFGTFRYDVDINGNLVDHYKTAQDAFDACDQHYPGEVVTVDIRP